MDGYYAVLCVLLVAALPCHGLVGVVFFLTACWLCIRGGSLVAGDSLLRLLCMAFLL